MDTATLERPATPPAERNVIGGREVEAASGRTLDVMAPGDGLAFARIAAGGAEDTRAWYFQ